MTIDLGALGWTPELAAALCSVRGRRAGAGARGARAHAHLPGVYRIWRVARARLRPPAPPGGGACRFSRRRRLGGHRAAGGGRRRADPLGAAAQEPVLTPRGGRSDRGADRRGQHRHGVPRLRARRRLQSPAHRTLPARGIGQRRDARRRPQQDRPGRGHCRHRSRGGGQSPSTSVSMPCHAGAPRRSRRCVRISDMVRRARYSVRPASASRLL